MDQNVQKSPSVKWAFNEQLGITVGHYHGGGGGLVNQSLGLPPAANGQPIKFEVINGRLTSNLK